MPGAIVTRYDQPAYVPAGSNAIVGLIGPATKGPINERGEFTSEGNFVATHGRPVDHQHGVRAGIRYLRYGNKLNYVRIAGTLLATAYAEQWKLVGSTNIPIITFRAESAGTWANGNLKVTITLNGDPAVSFNVYVQFRGRSVESYLNLTNANVETTINNNSKYIQVELHEDAGTTLPDSTIDSTLEQHVPLTMAHGDDGAFASSRSEDSSTGGVSARNSWAYNIAPTTGKTFSGSEGRYLAPGTLSVSTATPAEAFTDNGKGILIGSGGGTGTVDYLTGEWEVTFNAAPTANVAVSYNAGTYEIIGSSSAGVASDSGTINREGVRPSYLTIRDPREDVIDIGDGTTTNFIITVAVYMVPGSLVIVAPDIAGNTMTVTDDGDGTLSGDVGAASTIDYVTGALDVTFSAAVKNLEDIVATFKIYAVDNGSGVLAGDRVAGTINYQTGAWTLVHTLTPTGDHTPDLEDGGSIEALFRHTTVIDFGDNVETDFSGTLEEYPVKPGSITVVHGVGATLTDNGYGELSGAGGSGTIDYLTGEIEVSFTGAPALGFPIQVYYDSIILHFTSVYAGPIGNERSTITDGIFVWVDKASTTPTTNPADQWYRVRIMFNDGSGSVAVETFNSLRTVAELISTVNDEDTGSDYVRVEDVGLPGEINVAYDSNLGQKIGMDGAFTNSDVIGTHIIPNYTGLQVFANPNVVAMDFISAPGMWHRQISQAGIELCEQRDCIWIFSIPDFESPYDARDFVNGTYNAATEGGIAVPVTHIPYPPLVAVNSHFAFCCFPWILYHDAYSDEEVWEPGEGDVLALIAQVDIKYAPWYPIAGKRRGKLTNLSDIRYAIEDGELLLVYGPVGDETEVINCFVKFVGEGIYLFGERTMYREASAMDRLHAAWGANVLAKRILSNSRQFVFELNDEVLWREMRTYADNIMRGIAADRGVYDYRIVCDATTNTPDVIQNEKKAICKIFIKWTEAAEWIEFQLITTPLTVDFSEVAPVA